MKWLIGAALWLVSFLSLTHSQGPGLQYPFHDNGLNKVVQWDHYSLLINGERLMVWSGEFHYWRLPVPELWLDIMQKVKAAGWNTIAIYASWWYHNPSPGVLNFEHGAHDPELLFEYAKQVGLYILWRPGPYINAEANAGGFPGWVTTGAFGKLRDDDKRYHDAWYEYLAETTEIAAKHQVTNGGPVILVQLENEYGEQWKDVIKKIPNPPANNYMDQLEKCVRENGLEVPTITNAPNQNGRSWSDDYSNYTSNQDIYGLDSYPQCWSCDAVAECEIYGQYQTFSVQNYRDHFAIVSPTQPSFLPEFQGGSYSPWGGPEGGCVDSTGPPFVNVFYRDNLAQRVTIHSVYMTYGGTNWGGFAWDTVGTSYDYSAPIQENRLLGEKYHESRIIALQVRSAPGLTKTVLRGNDTSYSQNQFIYTTELQNLDSKARFYVVRHQPSNRTVNDPYKLEIKTLSGDFKIPQSFPSLSLKGQESKIFSTDYDLTSGRKVVYTTAEILSFSTVDKSKPLLVVWTTTDSTNEILLSGVGGKGTVVRGSVKQKLQSKGRQHTALLTLVQGASSSSLVIFPDGLRVLILDRASASTFYEPSLSSSPTFGPDRAIVVTGAYLVRHATQEGSTLAITGDLKGRTNLEVFPSPSMRRITFNGQPLSGRRTTYGSFTSTISPRIAKLTPPPLSSWRVTNNLPEPDPDYDDSRWTIADNTTTPNPTKPETLPVLWADDYNLFWGPILWRGRFSSAPNSSNSSTPASISLSVQGGAAFSYAVYLNGAFIGAYPGAKYIDMHNGTYSFSNTTLRTDGSENVILVIQDHTGKEMRVQAVTPRGIAKAALLDASGTPIGGQSSNSTGGFSSWRVAGTAGQGDHAHDPLLDPVRGPLAEGGWHHERLGWHLPGFEAPANWSSHQSSVLSIPAAGARYFHTKFPLDVPKDTDAALAFRLTDTGRTKNYRVWIYVNGYQYARMYSNVGNQVVFPVPPGIWDFAGDNQVGVVLWAMDRGGAEVNIETEVQGVLESSLQTRQMGKEIRTGGGWKKRLEYY